MLPFFKVFSLVIRAFSRPLIAYTKRYQSSNKQNVGKFLRVFFIRMGNFYNVMETKINKKFLKISVADDIFIKPLSDDVALDRGVEFFYEVIFYSIILALPLYEMYTTQVSNQQKADALNQRLTTLDQQIHGLHEKEAQQQSSLQIQLDELEKIIVKNDKTTSDVMNEMNNLKLEVNKLIQIHMKYIYKPDPSV